MNDLLVLSSKFSLLANQIIRQLWQVQGLQQKHVTNWKHTDSLGRATFTPQISMRV